MLNTLQLLTSIKTGAVAGVAEARPVTPWQGDAQQGFSGLLQRATQERAQSAPKPSEAPRPPSEAARAPAASPTPRPASPAGNTGRKPAAEAAPSQVGQPDAPPTANGTSDNSAADASGTARSGASRPASPREDAGSSRPGVQTGDAGTDDTRAEEDSLGERDATGLDALLLQGLAQAAPDATQPPRAVEGGATMDPAALAQEGLAAQSPAPIAAAASAPEDVAADAAREALADSGRDRSFAQMTDAGAGRDLAVGDGNAQALQAARDTRGAIELPADHTAVRHDSFHQELATAATTALPPGARAGSAAVGAADAAAPAAAGVSALHGLHGPALAASAAPTATAAPSGSTGAAAYALATPVDAPDFPQALATQISYIVRDGVQQAQLHLNPAEMGPVSVQIALHGQQAQVDFAAASSATRAAIESSLSDLAASLQSAGFTLTGGGVSQHPQQQGQASGQPPAEAGLARGQGGRDEAGAPTGHAAAPPRARTAGGLDLYA